MTHDQIMPPSGFHWREGWYFQRLESGNVRLRKDLDHPSQALPFVDIEIPASEWASIVSSVSAGGETGDRYRQTLAFHGESERVSS